MHIHSLDIKWETKNNIKSFQAEEFKTEEIKIEYENGSFHPVRYIHAEYDLTEKVFRHFDGAIHFYTEDEYYRRRDSDFNFNKKNTTHIKSIRPSNHILLKLARSHKFADNGAGSG